MKLLFIINSGSGNNSIQWPEIIAEYFKPLDHLVELYRLPDDIRLQTIEQRIAEFSPQKVIAVGGDGTVKLVAKCLIQKEILLGILPAGSANGLSKELGIPEDPQKALDIIVQGSVKKIHLTKINTEYCIHLSDLGLNAYAMKKFNMLSGRGMWGYLKATLLALRKNPLLQVEMQIEQKIIKMIAAMIVVANGTQYGTGAVINPIGKIDDDLFEVIVIKKISLLEIFKMVFFHAPFNTDKTEIFQTDTLTIRSRRKVHFQIDGEYLGMVKEVNATLLPNVIKLIVPKMIE
jgi:diacylglycerol kinase (ATP)